ncbi:hypothetical protein COU15_01450 [Candidatus Kaiserbacteria bacterium CG10_big_fil_rev_8_21_14_0_10_45_20]|uniref:Type II toxin-antitoxin system RelE/ParE family toxin n=1 Tax=Candidatus Kaiserbacteria bacterium CG10_big_fil_rev_8_21_14_0_10_45_20 TaxID=1974607 RepID=A0A2H0UFY8_9BACT|nr:MAG: hypothetical protein COU15_01450 [Candidatus Kaiserbacteria bacterium CG10_big_fil_rev_8_21_14_0_10_45_20]
MPITLLEPVEKFIGSLEKKTLAKTLRVIDLLEEFGVDLNMPHSKPMGDGVFELRIQGMQSVRLLYGFQKNRVYIVHGFIKKTQKTPRREYNLAKKRLDEI